MPASSSYNKTDVLRYYIISMSTEGSTCCNGVMSIPHDSRRFLSISFEVDERFIYRNHNLFPVRIDEAKNVDTTLEET